jgi:Ca-activated chloride channel family protein
MDLLWPGFLLLLGLIPLLIVAYIWMLRRRKRFAVRYSSLSLLRDALPKQSRWRRHLPFALFLVALVCLVFALVRPVAIISVPSGQTTIILAIDVSRSMCSTDIAPNRLEAAKDAAMAFIEKQGSTTQIGIVAFAGYAELIQPSTTDQEMLEAAIDSLYTGRRTAIGTGIVKSLNSIAEVDPSVAPVLSGQSSANVVPVPEGAYAADIIVLLTDGASNTGVEPVEAAQMAADRGVRVYTIGFGSEDGGVMDCSGQSLGFDPFGGGGQGFGGDPQFGGGGGRFRRGIDEETLKMVADMTGGTYYSAESASELNDVFSNLPTYLITRHEITELSVFFAAGGALLAALAILLSLLWNPLP